MQESKDKPRGCYFEFEIRKNHGVFIAGLPIGWWTIWAGRDTQHVTGRRDKRQCSARRYGCDTRNYRYNVLCGCCS